MFEDTGVPLSIFLFIYKYNGVRIVYDKVFYLHLNTVYTITFSCVGLPFLLLTCHYSRHDNSVQWPPLLTWFNFNPSMDK